jgi:long-chain-fatty-acid--[acyl-carrier-protein] ligase
MFWNFVCYVVRALLSLRYKVKVVGLEKLTPQAFNRKGGILFLPNHSAHIEPLLLFLILWPRYKMRPLVVEYIYRVPVLTPLMKIVNALQVPDFEASVNQIKIRRGEKAMDNIVQDLKQGLNFLVYPSGGLKRSAKEILGGASGVHAMLQKCPEANPVLIRTTGLWGSTFSPAIEGKTPDIGKMIFKGIKTIIKNGIFFAPRRQITIEFEPAPADFPREVSRIEFNRYLEDWYNRYPDGKGGINKEEPLNLVSYSAFRNELAVPFSFTKRRNLSKTSAVSTKTKHDIYSEIRKIVDNPQIEIRDEMNLSSDLGMDSLNIGELMAFLSTKFDVVDVHPEDLESVLNVLEIAEGARAASKPRHQELSVAWPQEPNRQEPIPPVGSTIPEAFLESCARMGTDAACADDLAGVISYKKMKKSALVLAQYFRTLKGDRIAVLLPSSYGAYLTILALQLAGKVPVMLNWTLGRRYLEEMMKLSGAESVISSWRFIDKLSHVEFGDLTDKMLLLEDIRASLSLKMKLKGLYLSFCGTQSILKSMGICPADGNVPAVILFTSGTEATPKGVPLSHKNIISNVHSAVECLDLKSTDVLYGILPPFHSFGFSVAGLCSILAGMKIAFYPDPTDSFALAEGIARWKISIFCSAPTFLRGLLGAAKSEQLKSVRYFVVGAERTPPELVEKVIQLKSGARVLEGYGITECSPILTITPPSEPATGVGRPISCVEMCMVHPETKELLPNGAEGEVCVKGPNVFSGYLGDTQSPFIQIHGEPWYHTGDLGRFDEKGSLILTGRLKRFTKVAGEMISLVAVEESIASALVKEGIITTEIPSIAVCADERNLGKPQLVLFSIIDIERDEANDMLHEAGFSRLIKIGAVEVVPEIPIMGSGKINHRQLQTTYLT